MDGHDAVVAAVGGMIGRPWDARRWFCWRLVAEIQGLVGRTLPIPRAVPRTAAARHSAFHEHPLFCDWRRAAPLTPWSVVLMSRCPAPRRDEHAGVVVMLPIPLILHVIAPQATILEDASRLAAQGWCLDFYEPV
jgi:hypothetical protein